ncbi:MAG: HvfB family MNIO-type RiPP peptide maturase [Gammaproteobacteria bacterium]
MHETFPVNGAGLGLRRTHLGPLQDDIPPAIDFFEAAPENWLGVGGRLGEAFERVAARRPLAVHGLLLNLGGPDPLDREFLARLRRFLDQHRAAVYSDHLSFCAERGHLYELLPIPFTEQALHHVAGRIREVQDMLGRRIAIENASYYLTLSTEMREIDFINGVLTEADCDLLLDVNNVYVNSVNQRYDAREFLAALPGERIAYAHIAGHSFEAEDLIVDTHGAPVSDPVWDLLAHAYECFGVFPTLLERDINIPPLAEVLPEVERIRELQAAAARRTDAA